MQLGSRRPLVYEPAFPTTPILDTFVRANEGPPPSANWTNQVENVAGGMIVVSNQLAGNSDAGSAWWSAASFGPNSECYLTFPVTGSSVRLYLRLQTPGSAAVDGYMLFQNAGTVVQLYRLDNNSLTLLTQVTVPSFVDGDAYGMRMRGTTLSAWRRASGSAQFRWLTAVDDAGYAGAGNVGVQFNNGTTRGSNFGGGTF